MNECWSHDYSQTLLRQSSAVPEGGISLFQEEGMAKLTTAKKNSEPKSDFGLPKERKYPMPDATHARNAKARASQAENAGRLSAADKKRIDAKADKLLGK